MGLKYVKKLHCFPPIVGGLFLLLWQQAPPTWSHYHNMPILLLSTNQTAWKRLMSRHQQLTLWTLVMLAKAWTMMMTLSSVILPAKSPLLLMIRITKKKKSRPLLLLQFPLLKVPDIVAFKCLDVCVYIYFSH